MHIVVLGAGITGVTTAYYLTELGHSVTVIDRASTVAAETSHANGGQLSYSYTDSLANPAFVLKMPSLLMGLDPAIRVRVVNNFLMFPWGIRFLAQCTAARAKKNTVAVLKIALRSAELLEQMQQKLALDFSYKTVGKLILLSTKSDVQVAQRKSAMKREYGCETQVLTAAEAVAKEPSLGYAQHVFSGAVFAGQDQVGDAREFTDALCQWLVNNRSVTLRLDEKIDGLEMKQGQLCGVKTVNGIIEADAAVVCLGPWSSRMLIPHGINPAIYPVRGYSVTLPPGKHAPTMSVTNLKHRILHSRLNDRIRVTGFADFAGIGTSRDGERISSLLETAKRLAPEAADYDVANIHPWGGFRPVTPSGRPVVGPTRIAGLFLNTGHGSLGWTLACATAETVSVDVGKAG